MAIWCSSEAAKETVVEKAATPTTLGEKRGASALGSGIDDSAVTAAAAALGVAGNVPIRLAVAAAAETSDTSVTGSAAARRSPPTAVALLPRTLERRCGMSVFKAATDSGVAADSGADDTAAAE